ncbi:Signal transduction histidine kinase [Labilithrix luteola]|uniref:histidine kinase n=1 Tax=Labilithrix luteola TaxID=1391654 RepID=A0A0K1PJE7_9BACT|nr:Signal transduction histidine kinase [Labilithrix luteola]
MEEVSTWGGLEVETTSSGDAKRIAAALWSWAAGSSLGLLAFTADGTVVAYNEPFARMWNVGENPPTSIVPFLEQIATEFVDADRKAFLEGITLDGGAWSRRVTRRDGRPFEWWSTPTPAVDQSEPLRVWGVRDARTDADLASALRTAESRLEVLALYTDGIVFELDADGRYLSIWTNNPALLARPSEDIKGRTLVEVLGKPLGEQLTASVRKLLATGERETLEYVIDVPEGRRWFTADPVLRPASPGHPPTTAFLVRDVTEQKKMQARLLQAERLASMGTLAAGVGHEINNPLAYLMLNLESISALVHGAGDWSPQTQPRDLQTLREAVRMAKEGAESVRKIVQDLRMFSREENVSGAAVDLRAVLDFSIMMALRTPPPGLRVTTEYGDADPPTVMAPEGRLVQIFVNLLTNAAQAMPSNRRDGNEIRVAVRPGEDGTVVVEVKDNGVGMPAEVLGHVFDPFFTTKTPGVGSGLGLSICHHIVTSLNGEISVESREGVGTTFRVTLPTSLRPELPQKRVR